jgi:hypothetical protein
MELIPPSKQLAFKDLLGCHVVPKHRQLCTHRRCFLIGIFGSFSLKGNRAYRHSSFHCFYRDHSVALLSHCMFLRTARGRHTSLISRRIARDFEVPSHSTDRANIFLEMND